MASEPRWTAASDEKNWSIASKKERNESPTASGWSTPVTLCGGEPQYHGEGGGWPAPVALDQRAIAAHQPAEDDRDQQRVVELTRDRDEVRDEVDRGGEVRGREDERDLLAARDRRVPGEPGKQQRAVGDEAGNGTRLAGAPSCKERGDEDRVERDRGQRDPEPRAHGSVFS